MKTRRLLFVLIGLAALALTGCKYYTNQPVTSTISICHGKSYVKHFKKGANSANRGVFFPRFVMDSIVRTGSNNGVEIFLLCDTASFHPLIIVDANVDPSRFELKKAKSRYLSAEYRTRNCFKSSDGSCNTIHNYGTGNCILTGVYFPKKVISKILEKKCYTGIVVYIGNDTANHYPMIMEGTSKKPGTVTVYNTNSVTSKTYCPRVCGTL